MGGSSSVQSVLDVESAKPLNAEDVPDHESATQEIRRMRAVFASAKDFLSRAPEHVKAQFSTTSLAARNRTAYTATLSSPVRVSTYMTTTLAGSGLAKHLDGGIHSAGTPNPVAMCIQGCILYVACQRQLKAVNLDTQQVRTIAGAKPASDALGEISGLALCEVSGKIFLSDAKHKIVRWMKCHNWYHSPTTNGELKPADETKLNPPEDKLHVLCGGGQSGHNDAAGTAAGLVAPSGLCIFAGHIFLCDQHCIKKINIESGSCITFCGGREPGHLDGEGTSARLRSPLGITASKQGELYVADSGNHRVRKISASGKIVTVAGSGAASHVDASVATAAAFSKPVALALINDRIFICDQSNHCIKLILPSGNVFTVAGCPPPTQTPPTQTGQAAVTKVKASVSKAAAGYHDAGGTDARFKHPRALVVAFTSNGGCPSLLVADQENHRIRRLIWNATAPTSFPRALQANTSNQLTHMNDSDTTMTLVLPQRTLGQDYQKLLTDSSLTDVTFSAARGEKWPSELHALRSLLVLRSRYFARMFDMLQNVPIVIDPAKKQLGQDADIVNARAPATENHLPHRLQHPHGQKLYVSVDALYQPFRSLLLFLMTDMVMFEEGDAAAVIACAEKFCCDQLRDAVQQKMMHSIGVHNACCLLETADRFGTKNLREASLQFVLMNFQQVRKSEGFACLPQPLMLEVVQKLQVSGYDNV